MLSKITYKITLLVLSSIDKKVDGALPLEEILHENIPLRDMIKSMNIEKKWLFTNAGKEVCYILRLVLRSLNN